MKWMTEHNLLCQQNGFKAVTASGPENMEGVMAEYRKTENFIVIDDTSDNKVYSGRPGWFTRSTMTVWIMASVKYNDGDDYNEKMKLCRDLPAVRRPPDLRETKAHETGADVSRPEQHPL